MSDVRKDIFGLTVNDHRNHLQRFRKSHSAGDRILGSVTYVKITIEGQDKYFFAIRDDAEFLEHLPEEPSPGRRKIETPVGTKYVADGIFAFDDMPTTIEDIKRDYINSFESWDDTEIEILQVEKNDELGFISLWLADKKLK